MEKINNEYYVSLEIAKLLKEAGFVWETEFGQHIWDRDKRLEHNINFNSEKYLVSLPTLEVAQRWLREVKNYYVSVDVDCDSIGVFYTVRYVFHDGDKYNASYIWEETEMKIVKHRRIFDNFEKAQEAGIKKALELILEKGE